MKFFALQVIILILLSTNSANAQLKSICVMGSSTAAGYFPDGTSVDSSWAVKIKKYYKSLGIIDTIYNIAASGRDCYTGMPTGYVPPVGRYSPDPLFNITRAVNFSPKPDIIIINFPSNNYEWLSNDEILFCLKTMRDTAVAHNIRCFITTTQPRDHNQLFQREKLRELKSLIENEFGVYSMDFWSPIVLDPPIVINPLYAFGDGVHLNPAGHTLLANVVIQKNIFFSPLAITFGNFNANQINNSVQLTWFSEPLNPDDYFVVQRSTDNYLFENILNVNSNSQNSYTVVDHFPKVGNNFYRIKIIKNGIETYSQVLKETILEKSFVGFKTTFQNNNFYISVPANTESFNSTVFDVSGKIIKTVKFIRPNTSREFKINLQAFPSGVYFIKLESENKNHQTYKVIKN